MIDLIPGVVFTDAEKQVYGSIAGAVIGALIGALAGAATTFLIGNRERKKQDEVHKIHLNRTYIRNSAVSIQAIELAIHDLLVKCEANNEYARDIQKGLIKQDANKLLALMQLSTPFEYPKLDITHAQNILNDKVVIFWNNLCQEVELQNKNIVDFAEYYKMLLSTVHSAVLKGEKIDVSVIKSDSLTIIKGMDQQLRANAKLREKCINVLAYVDCFKELIHNTDTRDFKSIKQYREYIEKIASYEPSEQELEKAKTSEESIYDPKIMFKSESTGDK